MIRKRLIISLSITPITYLLIASALVLLPFDRNDPAESLDFDDFNSGEAFHNLGIEEHYTARDGSKLFYRYFPSGARNTVILMHGSGSDGRYLTGLAQKLSASAGARVVLPDLRGHGRSGLSRMGDVDYLGQLEDDLNDLNEHLRSRDPGSSVILSGHSSAGGLAIKYGGRNDQLPFDGYLLLAPYLGYQAPTVRPDSGGWVQVSMRRYVGLAMFNHIGVTRFNGLPVLFFNRPPEWKDALQAESYSYRLNESFEPSQYSENLQEISQPMLVLVGRDDDAFYADEFEPIFAQFAPHARLAIIPGVKHLDLPDSEQAYQEISKWLAAAS